MQTFDSARIASCVLLATALAACGGGGGGGSDDTPAVASPATVTSPATPAPPPPAAPIVVPGPSGAISDLVITNTNATLAAAEAVQVVTGQDLGSIASNLVVGVEVQAAGAPAGAAQLAQAARRLLSLVSQGTALATAVTTEETIRCAGGGSITVTSNTSSEDSMRVGDEVRLVAAECVETVDGVSVRMQGAMGVKIVAGGLDPASTRLPVELTMRIGVNGFTLAAAGTTTALLGEMDAALVYFSENSMSLTMTSSGLRSSVSGAAGTRTETLRNFQQRLEYEPAGIRKLDLRAGVEVSGSKLGAGTVLYSVSTITPLRFQQGTWQGGIVQVVGRGSKLQLWGVPDGILYVDADGDGNFETNRTLKPGELQAQL